MRQRELTETTWLVLGIFVIYAIPMITAALVGS